MKIRAEEVDVRANLTSELAEVVMQAPIQIYPRLWRDLGEAGLTLPQLGALALLAQGPRRVSDIGSALGMGLPSTTSLLDRLEVRRLIAREHDPHDRRVVQCSLTQEGRDLLDRVSTSVADGLKLILASMSAEQLRTMSAAIERLSATRKQRLLPKSRTGSSAARS